MSKKAAEAVHAEPKFKQPWSGFLTMMTVLGVSYIVLQWFLHPVWGLATKMVYMNFYVASLAFGDIGPLLALHQATYNTVYPLGYLVDWIPFFIFCIVWIFVIGFLALWVPIKPLKRLPWSALGVIALSAIFAYITWYILGIVVGMQGYEMILLGTAGFLVFPIWLTLFNYWPLATPARFGWHPVIKGTIFASISWIVTIIIYWIINSIIWSNPIATTWTQYVLGNPLMPLLTFEPYDQWVSLLLSIIVGSSIVGIVNPWPGIKQPTRGLVLFITAIILGVIIWAVLSSVVGPSDHTLLIQEPVEYLYIFPYVSHANVSAYLAFPLVTLLSGQIAFQMWPWNRWGIKGNVGLVITAFIVGSILYFLFMVNPGWAIQLTGGNLIVPTSGLETVYLVALEAWYETGTYYAYHLATCYIVYFEGIGEFVGHALMFAWVLTVVIFGLLSYEVLHHWPWS